MAVTAAGLAGRFDVRAPDRRHEAFAAMAAATVAWIEREVGAPVHVAGHSDGAIVGLLVARSRPDLVRRLVFSSGVHHHSGWLPEVELDERHATEPALGPAELSAIAVPTLVMAADRDEMPLAHEPRAVPRAPRRAAGDRPRNGPWLAGRQARALQRDHRGLPRRSRLMRGRTMPP